MIKKTNQYAFQESAGNRLLEMELEKNRRIKTYFSENDKTPNTDGYFEILRDDGIPLKRFVVQIKSTANGSVLRELRTGEYSYSADSAFFQYIQNNIDSNPAMFFLIDVENRRIFFKYLSSLYLSGLWLNMQREQVSEPQDKAHKTVTIHFNEVDIMIEEVFYQLCEDIHKGTAPAHRPVVRNPFNLIRAISDDQSITGMKVATASKTLTAYNPKVFISYSWTTDSYQARVLELATKLVEYGVDVILDQWDLKYGQDCNVFMESSIRDAEKVLILCDKSYKEKADTRTGGVGAETSIIKREIFKKHNYDKFIPVIMEDKDVSEILPTYLRTKRAVFFLKAEQREYKELFISIFGNIEFGYFPKGKDGEEPICWRTLEVDTNENRVLLIAENLIDCRCYNFQWKDITWEDCSLRKWLNEDFLYEAFTEEERERIVLVSNENPDNTRYFITGGKVTSDKVFLLSLDEAELYFRDDKDRQAILAQYALKGGNTSIDDYSIYSFPGSWWLRSPGGTGSFASLVNPDGVISVIGDFVSNNNVFVRPA